MAKFIVGTSKGLKGNVTISGSKNAILPILAATLLTEEDCTVKSVPVLSDVIALCSMLKDMGVDIVFDKEQESIAVRAKNISKTEADYEKAGKLRGSFLIMGPLLARYKEANIPLPGGCPIGSRPVDLHLKGFSALGAKTQQAHGSIHITARQLKGDKIYLDFPSVGATENIMMAATLAKGVTTIVNAAAEPEIIDLATFLKKMGADISGEGTDTITITGVKKLHGAEHTVMPDRIEAGTYLAFAAANGNGVLVKNVITEHLDPFIAKLQEMGVRLEIHEDSIYVPGGDLLVPVTVKTAPFPGFATDLQQPLTPLLLKAQGSSRIIDTLYPERVKHIPEMRKMGAKISSKDGIITVKRSKDLLGTTVEASEIRAGVSLLGLALMAEGTTVITKADNILRGYDRIVDKLKGLSVKVEIITDNRE